MSMYVDNIPLAIRLEHRQRRDQYLADCQEHKRLRTEGGEVERLNELSDRIEEYITWVERNIPAP